MEKSNQYASNTPQYADGHGHSKGDLFLEHSWDMIGSLRLLPNNHNMEPQGITNPA